MSTENIQALAVVVMLAALPLLASGGDESLVGVAVAGFVIFAVGALALTVLRFRKEDA